jgi:hypothetical protein
MPCILKLIVVPDIINFHFAKSRNCGNRNENYALVVIRNSRDLPMLYIVNVLTFLKLRLGMGQNQDNDKGLE